jgi:hypothetical protein
VADDDAAIEFDEATAEALRVSMASESLDSRAQRDPVAFEHAMRHRRPPEVERDVGAGGLERPTARL